MDASRRYLFTSERLGFGTWLDSDLEEFAAMNADPVVMRHFPSVLSEVESSDFLKRLNEHFESRGHTYFAVELKHSQEWIGFIGLAFQEYEAPFTPAVDIGWRLRQNAWGKGLATEGAKRCLDYGFEALQLDRIVATCPATNANSERVMRKIGMVKKGEFLHPKLTENPKIQRCVWYEQLAIPK